MMLALASLLLLATLTVVAGQLHFTAMPQPPWAPRILQGFAFPVTPITYVNGSSTLTAYPSNQVIVSWGGSAKATPSSLIQYFNDVYISTDGANSWLIIGGVGVYSNTSFTPFNVANYALNGNHYYTIPSAVPNGLFTADDGDSCKTYDRLTGMFYVFDTTYGWSSQTGTSWTTLASTEYVGHQDALCYADIVSRLYLISGSDGLNSTYQNDVWTSAVGGNIASWTDASQFAPWAQRDSMSGFSYVSQGVSLQYAMGGHDKPDNLRSNQVWVSANAGVNWTLIALAPWTGRDHASAGSIVTPTNVIMLFGGKLNATDPVTGNNLNVNDVWATLDGGYTWGQCTSGAEWPPRQDHTAVLGPDGYVYISGGWQNKTIYWSDFWKSTINISDPIAVGNACGLSVPSVIGLSNFAGIVLLQQASTTSFALCYQAQSSLTSQAYPWSDAISLTITGSAAFVDTTDADVAHGGRRLAVTVLSAVGMRIQFNYDGTTSSATLSLTSRPAVGADQILYIAGPPYTDSNGISLQVGASTDAPNGKTGYVIYPNGFAVQFVKLYTALPAYNVTQEYLSDATTSVNVTLTPLSAGMTIPTCTPVPINYTATGLNNIISWTVCLQISASASAAGGFGPYAIAYDLSITTSGNPTVSPITGQTGYAILTVYGTRVQWVRGLPVTTSNIVGLGYTNTLNGTENSADNYLYANPSPVSKVVPSTATINSITLIADNYPVLPNGVQTATGLYQSSELSLVTVGGVVVEAYNAEYSYSPSTGVTPLPSSAFQLPTFSNLSVASVSAVDHISESDFSLLPTCPLQFIGITSSTQSNMYTFCITAQSSASDASGPWYLTVTGTLTVASYPTLTSTGQYGFAVVGITGTLIQNVRGIASTATLSSAPGVTAYIYFAADGLANLDTTGAKALLSTPITFVGSSTSSSYFTVTGTVQPLNATVSPAQALTFATSTNSGPWSARLIPGIFPLSAPYSYKDANGNTQIAPANSSLLLVGGQFNTTLLYNDVWLSTNFGVSWSIIAGPGSSPLQPQTTFNPTNGGCKIRDSTGLFYIITGSYSSFVTTSTDAITWTSYNYSQSGQASFPGRAYPLCLADSNGNVYLMGGQGQSDDHTTFTATYKNDVWTSTNQAQSWTPQTLTATWDIRDSMIGVMIYSPYIQKTVIIHSGGHDDTNLNFRPNEVWASSDLGVSWSLFPRAPYVGRNHGSMLVTKNNVIAVVAGKTDVVGINPLNGQTNANLGFNDVWVSVDGALSWSLCTNAANFPPRQDLGFGIDAQGYIYVSSGINGLTTLNLNDTYRSAFSFANLSAVSAACQVVIPGCGTGLRCWPSATTETNQPFVCPCQLSLGGFNQPASSALAVSAVGAVTGVNRTVSTVQTCAAPSLGATGVSGVGSICAFIQGNVGTGPWAPSGTNGWAAVVQATITYTSSSAVNAFVDFSSGSYFTITGVVNGSISVYSPFINPATGSQAVVTAAIIGVAAVGQGGASNAIYNSVNANAPLDKSGIVFMLSSGIEFPSESGTFISSSIDLYFPQDPITGQRYVALQNFGKISESQSSFFSDLPGIVSIGASYTAPTGASLNSPSGCTNAFSTSATAMIGSAVSAPSQPAITTLVTISYNISDNLSYVIRVVLNAAVTQQTATDAYGVSHAVITVTSGSRYYGYGTPANNFSSSTVTSTVNPGACLTANQYFYADPSQYPYLDASGIQYSVRPTQPLVGLPATTASRKSTAFTVYADPGTGLLREIPSATQSVSTSSSITFHY